MAYDIDDVAKLTETALPAVMNNHPHATPAEVAKMAIAQATATIDAVNAFGAAQAAQAPSTTPSTTA